MPSQEDAFKPGERTKTAGTFYCTGCDRKGTESLASIDVGEVFPFCTHCKEAGVPETDFLWVPIAQREAYRKAQASRWREMWKV